MCPLDGGRTCQLNAEDIKQTQKERKTYAPRRLPRQRLRTLTYPLPAEPVKSSRSWNPFKRSVPQQTIDQLQSELFAQLPSEIRRLIWREVLGRHLLHVARAPKRLFAIGCAENFGPELQTRRHGCWGVTDWSFKMGRFNLGLRGNHPATPANLLPLLQTCRIVYTEAISILYQDNVFDVNHLDTLIYLQRSVLPQRLDQIHVLNFTWDFRWRTATQPVPYGLATWREACSALASFAGLQELTVHLTGGDLRPCSGGHWEPLLEALTRIKATKKFDVFLPCLGDEYAEAVKEGRYPFRLAAEPPLAPEEYYPGNMPVP